MNNILFEVSPVSPVSGVAQTFRFAHLDAGASGTQLDGKQWLPAITEAPVFETVYAERGVIVEAETTYGAIRIALSERLGTQELSSWGWQGALARIFVGEEGGDFASYKQVFEGACGIQSRSGPELSIELVGLEALLDTRDLISASYAGTGGAEGPASMKGQTKPFAIGACANITPVLIDPAHMIYQYHAGTSNDVAAVYENALSLGAPVSTVATTYAQLRDLTLTPGQWAKAPGVGMFRLGGQPSGKLTADVEGVRSGSTFVHQIGTIVPMLLGRAGHTASQIGNFSTWSQSWSFYTDDQVTIGEVVRAAMLQAGGHLITDSRGRFQPVRFVGSNATPIVLREDRSALPLVHSVVMLPATAPIWAVEIGHTRNWTTHNDSEISPALREVQESIDASEALAQEAYDRAVAARAQADLANARHATIANDDILDRAEKAQVRLEWANAWNESAEKVSIATGLEITTELTSYQNALSNLSHYLTLLSPAWDDGSTDTPIDRSVWNARWSDLYQARATLANKISTKSGAPIGTYVAGKPVEKLPYLEPIGPGGGLLIVDIDGNPLPIEGQVGDHRVRLEELDGVTSDHATQIAAAEAAAITAQAEIAAAIVTAQNNLDSARTALEADLSNARLEIDQATAEVADEVALALASSGALRTEVIAVEARQTNLETNLDGASGRINSLEYTVSNPAGSVAQRFNTVEARQTKGGAHPVVFADSFVVSSAGDPATLASAGAFGSTDNYGPYVEFAGNAANADAAVARNLVAVSRRSAVYKLRTRLWETQNQPSKACFYVSYLDHAFNIVSVAVIGEWHDITNLAFQHIEREWTAPFVEGAVWLRFAILINRDPTSPGGEYVLGARTRVFELTVQDTSNIKAVEVATNARIASAESVFASETSALGRRTSVMEVAAVTSPGWLNANTNFAIWGDTNPLPAAWTWWIDNAGAGVTRVATNDASSGYVVRQVGAAGVVSGFYQYACKILPGWYVLEADVELLDGTHVGAGLTLNGVVNLSFATDSDTNGVVSQGGYHRRRWSKLVQVTEELNNFHAMCGWDGFGVGIGYKYIHWHFAGVRPASDGEIKAQKASADVVTAIARIEAEELTRADQTGALATRTSAVEARSSGGGNLLSNTTLDTMAGWTAYDSLAAAERTFAINLAGELYHPKNEHVLGVRQAGTAAIPHAYIGYYSDTFHVTAGEWIQWYVYAGSHRAYLGATLYFLDHDGGVVGVSDISGQRSPEGWMTTLSGFVRVGFPSVQVPVGTTHAYLQLRKFNTDSDQHDSYAWWYRPYVSQARQGQTEWNAFTHGSGRAATVDNRARIAAEESTRAAESSALATRSSAIEARARLSGSTYVYGEEFNSVDEYTDSWQGGHEASAGRMAMPPGSLVGTAFDNRETLILTTNVGNYYAFSTKLYPVDTSKRYRLDWAMGAYHNGGAGTGPVTYVGVVCLDGRGQLVNHGSLGSYRYAGMQGQRLPDTGFITNQSVFMTGESNDLTWQHFAPGTKFVRLMFIANYLSDSNCNTYIDYIRFREAEGEAKAIAADARISSVESAMVANNSAQTTRTNTLEASMARNVFINRNALFQEKWDAPLSTGNHYPPGWHGWNNEGGAYHGKAGDSIRANYSTEIAPQLDRNSQHSGMYQNGAGNYAAGWYVIEAEVQLEDGTSPGAGVHFANTASSWNLNFYQDKSIDGVNGYREGRNTWRFTKLVNSGAFTGWYLYAMAGYTGFGYGYHGFLRTIWHRCGVRPATQSEIDAQQATIDVGTISARTSITETAIVDLKGRTAAHIRIAAGAGTEEAVVSVMADGSNSMVNIAAKSVTVGANRTLEVHNGQVRVNGNLRAGAKILAGSGEGWQIALKSRDFSVSDGETIQFGYDFGYNPESSINTNGLAPLNSGESYRVYLDNLTSTSAVARLRINVPGAPSNITLTGDYAGGSGPHRHIAKTPNADSSNNSYRMEAICSVSQYVHVQGNGNWNPGNPEPIIVDPEGGGYATFSAQVSIWAHISGIGWQKVKPLYASYSDYFGYSGTYTQSFAFDDTFSASSNVDYFGFSVDSSSGSASSQITRVSYSATGTAAGDRSATPGGQKAVVTIRP